MILRDGTGAIVAGPLPLEEACKMAARLAAATGRNIYVVEGDAPPPAMHDGIGGEMSGFGGMN